MSPCPTAYGSPYIWGPKSRAVEKALKPDILADEAEKDAQHVQTGLPQAPRLSALGLRAEFETFCKPDDLVSCLPVEQLPDLAGVREG